MSSSLSPLLYLHCRKAPISCQESFLACAHVCEESDEIVSIEKLPGTCSELIVLLLPGPIGMVRGATLNPCASPSPASLARHSFPQSAWKPEVPFTAGSIDDSGKETSCTLHKQCQVQTTGGTN